MEAEGPSALDSKGPSLCAEQGNDTPHSHTHTHPYILPTTDSDVSVGDNKTLS